MGRPGAPSRRGRHGGPGQPAVAPSPRGCFPGVLGGIPGLAASLVPPRRGVLIGGLGLAWPPRRSGPRCSSLRSLSWPPGRSPPGALGAGRAMLPGLAGPVPNLVFSSERVSLGASPPCAALFEDPQGPPLPAGTLPSPRGGPREAGAPRRMREAWFSWGLCG